MTSLQSKFAKSLQNHTLQNLVFQKRQRKNIQQLSILPALLPKHKPHKKTPQKVVVQKQQKKSKKLQKKQVKTQPIPKTKKITKMRKYLTSKDLLKKKNKKAPVKSQPVLKNTQNIKLTKNRIKRKFLRKNQNKNIKQVEINKKSNKIKPQKIKAQKSLIKQNKRIQKSQSKQDKQDQIPKTPKKIGRPRKVIQPVSDQNINDDNRNSSPIKSRALLSLLQSGSKKSLNEQQQTPKQPRQAKLNALKKYTQKEMFPEDSYECQKGLVIKKKRISKTHQAPSYSINRIFRKQPKLDLNPINIDIKLDRLSLNSFVQKFGTFDVIHSSLPLSFLWEMKQIQNLMVKGFIFIWVEKGQIPIAYHFLNKLGYDVIDQIVWIKSNQSTRTVFNQPITQQQPFVTQENLFLNSKSVCFVGYKCPTGQKAQYRTKISNNLIFATPCQRNPTKKPDQIFEIADLLMPGSRKLQLGGVQQKGWLSLHHVETRLRKCFSCFCDLSIVKTGRIFKNENTQSISSVCQRCYQVYSQRSQQKSQQNESEQQQNQLLIEKDQSIEIQSITYLNHQEFKQCSKCKQNTCNQLIICKSLKRSSQTLQNLCIQCFESQFQKHKKQKIQIILKKQFFLNRIKINCSSCQKNTLVSHYYQCIAPACKNKKHIKCQQCFWKFGYQAITNNQTQKQSNKRKNEGYHQWKIRKITSVPYQKMICSCTCKNDLMLPYFVCQNCVGWRWCGKCKLDPKSQQNHDHHCIQTQDSQQMHKISLIC